MDILGRCRESDNFQMMHRQLQAYSSATYTICSCRDNNYVT